MNKPQLSIIIATWNTAKITFNCITSIKKYLKNISYEIIVVDNNSTDNTKLLLSKINYIKYIHNSDNFGYSRANNIGASQSSAKFLLFLNSDMLLIDNSLPSLIDFYNKNPDIGIIGPQFLNPDLKPQASAFPDQSIINAFKEYWLHQTYAFSKYLPNLVSPSKVWAISGGALLINRQLFLKIGGWDEKYHLYFEDLALCRSTRSIGKNIFYFPNCRVIHYHGASGKNLTNSTNQWRRLIRGSQIYHGYLKHYLLTIILWIGQKI